MNKLMVGFWFWISLFSVVNLASCQDPNLGQGFYYTGYYTSATGKVVPLSLLGTLHITSIKDLPLTTTLTQDLESKALLLTEVSSRDMKDLAAMQSTLTKYGLLPQGRTLKHVLGKDYPRVESAFKELGGALSLFDQYQPWYVSLIFTQLYFQKWGVTLRGSEFYLMAWATEKGREFEGLETLEHQFQALSSGSIVDHKKELLEMLEVSEDDYKKEWQALERAWIQGDREALGLLVNEELRKAGEVRYEALMTLRNEAWAERILSELEAGTSVFAAVGSGHLVGNGSLLSLLAEKGVVWENVILENAGPEGLLTP